MVSEQVGITSHSGIQDFLVLLLAVALACRPRRGGPAPVELGEVRQVSDSRITVVLVSNCTANAVGCRRSPGDQKPSRMVRRIPSKEWADAFAAEPLSCSRD
jgi:hypothetical protein